jgi:hypothetical protein
MCLAGVVDDFHRNSKRHLPGHLIEWQYEEQMKFPGSDELFDAESLAFTNCLKWIENMYNFPIQKGCYFDGGLF